MSLGSGVFFLLFGLSCEESLKIFDEGVPAELLGLDDLDVSVCVFGDVVPICGFLSQDRDQEKPKLKRSSSCCNLRKALLAIAFDILTFQKETN